MMDHKDHKFLVKMNPDALREYNDLDNSIIRNVDKAIESLEQRADEVGKVLGKKREINLTGLKEKKLRGPGVRIIYTITKEYVEVLRIVVILVVGFKKDETTVYENAQQRFDQFKEEETANRLTPWTSDSNQVADLSGTDKSDTPLLYYVMEVIDKQYEVRLDVIYDIIGIGASLPEALNDLGARLMEYSNSYISNYSQYINDPVTHLHFRYIIMIIELAGDEQEVHRIVANLFEK